MKKGSVYRNFSILFLGLMIGLGAVLVLPWLADAQSKAAEIDFDAPGVVPRYYVAKLGGWF